MADWKALQREMAAWRHELHAHPEFGFEERRTAAFVAARLRELGLDEVVEGVGGTGVVATLRRGRGRAPAPAPRPAPRRTWSDRRRC